MFASPVSLMEIDIYIQTLSLPSDAEGELVLRNPVSSFIYSAVMFN